jgi:antitoxin MazE
VLVSPTTIYPTVLSPVADISRIDAVLSTFIGFVQFITAVVVSVVFLGEKNKELQNSSKKTGLLKAARHRLHLLETPEGIAIWKGSIVVLLYSCYDDIRESKRSGNMDKARVVEEIAKVNIRGSMTIPAAVRKAIGMEGEALVVTSAVENGNEILIRVQMTVDRDQAWFWTPEWQVEEKASAQDYRDGKVTRMSADDFSKEIENW